MGETLQIHVNPLIRMPPAYGLPPSVWEKVELFAIHHSSPCQLHSDAGPSTGMPAHCSPEMESATSCESTEDLFKCTSILDLSRDENKELNI